MLSCCLSPVLSFCKNCKLLDLSFLRYHCREQRVKCIGYTKLGPVSTVCSCSSKCKAKWRIGYTRKAVLLLPIVIQLTSLVLCKSVGVCVGVGVGVGVGIGVGKGVWRQG